MKRISTSDRTYANALVQLNEPDMVAENLTTIQQILTPELNEVLVNPAVSEGIKYSIIDDVFTKDIDKKMVEFLKVLVSKKRFGDLETIVAAFNTELDKINNIKRVEIISAIDLSDEHKWIIAERLHHKLQKHIEATWSVDKEIIAGLVVKIEDDIIDTSLRTQLENLRKNIV
jgi:F-type H+-transporting ATPase subunit delta